MAATSAGARTDVRIARPSADLPAAERFSPAGLGLTVLMRVAPPDVPAPGMVMLGWAEAGWHVELVGHGTAPQPTVDDLLVLYLGDDVPGDRVDRSVDAGGRRVDAHDPLRGRLGRHRRGPGRLPAGPEDPAVAPLTAVA